MRPARRSRATPGRRTLLAAGALGGLAGAALAQRAHLRSLAADPDLRALGEPLGGRVDVAVSRDGTRLHVERFGGPPGAGDPRATLVLAPGWTERIDVWGPVIRRLGRGELELIAYDLRGHGASDPAAGGDYGLDRFGEDLAAVLALAATPPERTAVAGHSLGAMSLAAWARREDVASRIGAAALVNTGLSDLIGGALLLGPLAARLGAAGDRFGRAVLGSPRPMLPVSSPLSLAINRYVAFGPDATDGTVAFFERMVLATEPGARAATGVALSTLDLSDAVARIDVPALVIAGERDRLTPPAHARRIAAALPRLTELLELERTGHLSPLEQPDAVAAAISRLLSTAGVTA